MATAQGAARVSSVVDLSGLYKYTGTDLPVILVSDTETVDKSRGRTLDYEVCTWLGDYTRVDWSPMLGRDITIWPTNLSDCDTTARKLGEHLAALGFTSGRIIKSEGQPPGWTYADCLAERINPEEFCGRENGRHLRPLSVGRVAVTVKGVPAMESSRHIELKKIGFKDGERIPANEDTVDRILEGAGLPFWYDEFLQRVMTSWQSDAPRPITDGDVSMLTVHLQRNYGLQKMSVGKVRSGLDTFLLRHRTNAARDALRGLVWDGTERLPTMMSKGWGTPQNAYYAAVGRCWIMGMVNRVLSPGCQFDNFPLFEGGEGAGKSTALRVIGGDWFSECHESIMSKDFQQLMPGKMLLEIAELHSFKRAEIERIKGIISNRVDSYRPSYGRTSQDFPRSCSFAGTTNRNDWNMSDTGMRRAWRIIVGRIDLYYLRANRDQLLAEAVARLDVGQVYHDVPEDEARRMQEDAKIEEPWYMQVLAYADARSSVSIPEILQDCLGIPIERHSTGDATRVRSIIRQAGYTSIIKRMGGRTARVWHRGVLSMPEESGPKASPDPSEEIPF